jgi:Leishmanolysin
MKSLQHANRRTYRTTICLLLLVWCSGKKMAVVTAQQPNDPDVDLVTCVPVGTASQFEITLVNMGDVENTEARFVAALEKAAGRWRKIIINDLPNFRAGVTDDWFGGTFDRPYTGAVDDVVIGYDLSSTIDGPGGTLGQAGGIFSRVDRRTGVATSTISGVMKFDVADLQRMPDEDFKAVALHEMGHVLGLVGANGACSAACNPNNSREQGKYECPLASRIYNELSASVSLFLENNGGMGTACGHWEEDSFQFGESSEIMTGFFEPDLFQPVSLVTVAALHEMGGYEVDYCGADIWPADETTIKRYEVYRTQNGLDMDTAMGTSPTIMGMDDSGRPVPLFGPSSGTDHLDTFLWILLGLSIFVALVVLCCYRCCRR